MLSVPGCQVPRRSQSRRLGPTCRWGVRRRRQRLGPMPVTKSAARGRAGEAWPGPVRHPRKWKKAHPSGGASDQELLGETPEPPPHRGQQQRPRSRDRRHSCSALGGGCASGVVTRGPRGEDGHHLVELTRITLLKAVMEGIDLVSRVLSCLPQIIPKRESVEVPLSSSYFDRLRRARQKCEGVKGNLVQHIIPLVAEIDWQKWNRIHNCP